MGLNKFCYCYRGHRMHGRQKSSILRLLKYFGGLGDVLLPWYLHSCVAQWLRMSHLQNGPRFPLRQSGIRYQEILDSVLLRYFEENLHKLQLSTRLLHFNPTIFKVQSRIDIEINILLIIVTMVNMNKKARNRRF